jgi:LacI family transcriptional regulator
LLLEVERFFFDRGYSVFICNTEGKPEKELRYLRSLDSKLVDGLICIAALDPLPTDAMSRNIPVVYIDRIEHGSDDNFYLVSSDHRIGGFLTTEELIRSGALRILLLTKQRPDPIMAQRYAGYCDALQKYGIAVDDDLVIRLSGSRPRFDEARDAVSYLLAKGLSFDGIFGVNDWRAYGALVALQQNGIDVPGKVRIVGFDDSPIAQRSVPALSTIYQDRYAIASKACELLYNLISRKDVSGSRRIVVPVSLVSRQTT